MFCYLPVFLPVCRFEAKKDGLHFKYEKLIEFDVNEA